MALNQAFAESVIGPGVHYGKARPMYLVQIHTLLIQPIKTALQAPDFVETITGAQKAALAQKLETKDKEWNRVDYWKSRPMYLIQVQTLLIQPIKTALQALKCRTFKLHNNNIMRSQGHILTHL